VTRTVLFEREETPAGSGVYYAQGLLARALHEVVGARQELHSIDGVEGLPSDQELRRQSSRPSVIAPSQLGRRISRMYSCAATIVAQWRRGRRRRHHAAKTAVVSWYHPE